MQDLEQTVRAIFATWQGADEVVDGWKRYCSNDIVWWNSARGALTGMDENITGLRRMQEFVGAHHWRVNIKNIWVVGDTVIAERTDTAVGEDARDIAGAHVVGIINFNDAGQVTEWRDYCDDWTRDFRPNAEQRSFV
ncbi:nuclear transport factor 2 family protein [Mycobacterium paraintracellulare]|uniref:nuclear transport factor 2 family protein n=1 Tax=Mycobacterium paraintracellulare TaxID=1138383 RepID=UPI00192785E0|nr:limonene-1,2-epoxide hydrolase family protein [Mycobacterium paraintracellulare]BCP14189.1 hypothetical protein MINTM021_10980 [Mycobacterium paraintracellulare]